jgi:hypothetical protein
MGEDIETGNNLGGIELQIRDNLEKARKKSLPIDELRYTFEQLALFRADDQEYSLPEDLNFSEKIIVRIKQTRSEEIPQIKYRLQGLSDESLILAAKSDINTNVTYFNAWDIVLYGVPVIKKK